MHMEMTFKELDELKDHLAQVLEGGISKQIAPILAKADSAVAKVESMEARVAAHAEEIGRLKANQAKAITMWTLMIGALGTGVTLGFNYVKGWLATHLHLS
jgi:hypothetical protein